MKNKYNNNLVNLINLDKVNPKYLIPIFPILFFTFKNIKSKYNSINLINLDKTIFKYFNINFFLISIC